MSVNSTQRFTKAHPCPVCSGWDDQARGKGERCYGFLSTDGGYVHCTRPEYAGDLPLTPGSNAFTHRLIGECRCGKQHGHAVAPVRHATPSMKIVTTYPYLSASGQLLYEVVRYRPKTFKQRRPDGKGGWLWNLTGVDRVLYRLSELIANSGRLVFIVEGEKDADALSRLGLLATTNAGGAAGKWQPSYSAALAGRHVAILPDNDEPGRTHAATVAAALAGVAASVRVVALPGLPDKGDVSDWLADGGTRTDLEALVKATAAWAPDSANTGFTGFSYMGKPVKPENQKRELCLTALSDLLNEPPEDVSWTVDDLLPSSGVSILAAKPKVGKSTIARCLSYAVATGTPFLGRATQQGTVVYLALEEKRSEVADHFREMGATDEPIFIHTGRAPEDALPALVAAIEEHRPVLAVIDPLLMFCRIQDLNDYAQVTRALEPVIALARLSGCHILSNHHMGKAERAGADGILGSTALLGAVDTALIERRKEDGTRTLFSVQRYGKDLPESVLTLDETSGQVALAGDVATLQLEDAERKVLNAIGQDELTQADIRGRVGGNEVLTVKALHVLLDAGKVTRAGKGRRADPYLYRGAEVLEPQEVEETDSENTGFTGFNIGGKPVKPENQYSNGAAQAVEVGRL